MRSSKSRSRSKNNRNRPSGGNIVNRVFDSSGPEGKVRGTPQQIIDKYTQLFRDAQLSGDRVSAENFAQHAEHYTRMLSEAQREAEQRRDQNDQQQRDRHNAQQNGQSGNDRSQNDQSGQSGDDRGREDRGRSDQQADHRQGGDQRQGDHQQGRNDDPQQDRSRGGADQDVAPTRDTASDARGDAGSTGGDVIDSGESESGLVETPESQGRKPRSRRSRPAEDKEPDTQGSDAPAAGSPGGETSGDAPQGAEPAADAGAEKPAKAPAKPRASRSRARKKAVPEGEAGETAPEHGLDAGQTQSAESPAPAEPQDQSDSSEEDGSPTRARKRAAG